MSKISSEKHLEKEPHVGLIPSQKHTRKPSLNSSSDSDSFFINIKKDIKALLENDENISISSNSEEDSQNKNEELDYLLESRFWKPKKYNEINKEKIKKEKGIREESNKQSTQENEDEEIRNEQINNNSSSESNNSPYNEANDNERNFDKNNHYLNNEKKDEKNKINNNINIINNNNDKNNLNGTNILLNGSNFANNINYKNMNGYSKFVFPYRIQFPDKDMTYYYMIHASKHIKGISIMKSSYAKYNEGKVEYYGADKIKKLPLFQTEKYINSELDDFILKEFSNQRIQFVNILEKLIDTTEYLESDIKNSIKRLKDLNKIKYTPIPATTPTGRTKKKIDDTDILDFS